MTTSIYDMTVRMDVINLVNYCKEQEQSFFINCLYLTLRELNAIPDEGSQRRTVYLYSDRLQFYDSQQVWICCKPQYFF